MLLGALAMFARANLSYTGFWYDETVQFWISRGADAFSPPGTPGRGLRGVVRQNGRGNLDPGGFSFLLSAWMRGGTSPTWLRLLPFVLFLVGLGTMAWLGWLWHPSPAFALVAASVPLAYPLLLYHATEVRAYTMEFAGVAIGCLFLQWAATRLTVGSLALTGIALAAFMTSRYSYSIFAAAACLALVPVLWRSSPGSRGERLRRFVALGAPVFGGALFIAANLWLQRARFTGGFADYLGSATAAGKSAGVLATSLGANLLSPVALPVTCAAIVLAWRRWLTRPPAGLLGIGASSEARLLYRVAAWTLALSAILWRWHPWNVHQKWSLFLHALSAVLLVRLVADVLGWLTSGPRAERLARAGRAAAVTGMVTAALVVLGLGVHAATARRTHGNDLTPALAHLERESLGAGSVAVGVHPYPTLRYLSEQGPFVGRLPYPAAFRLPHWHGPRPLIGPETRYLIAYERPEELPRLHPGLRFRAAGPRNLYAVEPAPGP
jgi:hypothetical protein